MTSILDMKAGQPRYWEELLNLLAPLKSLIVDNCVEPPRSVDANYLLNSMFWILIIFSISFGALVKMSHTFNISTNVKFYKRKQFVRSIWNFAFYAASTFFLYFYNKFMISPQLDKTAGRFSLFPSSENLIFYKSEQCEKFQLYFLFINTFYLHSAILDFNESDFVEAASKTLYMLSLVALNTYKYENYFVGLNLNIGIYNIMNEGVSLVVLQNTSHSSLVHKILLGLRFTSWSHIFISVLPFKYLVPTLFAKNFKAFLNMTLWLWYGLSIWNSPVLQCFYHQIYHNPPVDCCGDGSAAKCILFKDSNDHRHFKSLKKAYLEVKLANERMIATAVSSANESASTRTFQAIKCIMTLKRKLKRIREGRGEDHNDIDNDNDSQDVC